MPKCIKGHRIDNLSKCTVCGERIDLKESLGDLLETPQFTFPWEQTATLSFGQAFQKYENAYNVQLIAGDEDNDTVDLFAIRHVSGDTWFDVLKNNSERFRRWLDNTGFSRAQYKFIAIDTTDPLAVLTVSGLGNLENAVILALIADGSSNPVSQNTSYVTLKLIKMKKLPVIVVSKDYINDLPFFVEDVALTINTDSLNEISSLFVSCMDSLIDFITRDLKLGVTSHCLSAVLSASDMVYGSPETALALQQKQASVEVDQNDIQTAYLFGRTEKAIHEDLALAFKKQFDGRRSRLLTSDVRFYEKRSSHSARALYDLVILLGVKEFDLGTLERGYNLVASKNSDLKLKST